MEMMIDAHAIVNLQGTIRTIKGTISADYSSRMRGRSKLTSHWVRSKEKGREGTSQRSVLTHTHGYPSRGVIQWKKKEERDHRNFANRSEKRLEST